MRVNEMKYRIMFWLMCAVLCVCFFWLLPLTYDDSFRYFAVVLQVYIATLFIVGFTCGFGYLAHKAFNL